MSLRVFPSNEAEGFRARVGTLARTLEARFVELPLGEESLEQEDDHEWRKKNCEFLAGGECLDAGDKQWLQFLDVLGVPPARRIYARLNTRLLIGVAGGVFENGGVTLDRLTGRPMIPGSGVKGCARRRALIELAHETAEKKAEKLALIARVFGWIQEDWRNGRKENGELYSDFAWACGDADWPEVRSAALQLLGMKSGAKQDDEDWRNLHGQSGCVNFLPAHVVVSPKKRPDLETDVLTNHHKEYYADPESGAEGVWRKFAGNLPREAVEEIRQRAVPDVEEPNPVLFPAVAPRNYFVFSVHGGTPEQQDAARTWLARGLEGLGIGARTGSGYGWFDCSEENAGAVARMLGQTADAKPDGDPVEADRKAVRGFSSDEIWKDLERFTKAKKGLTESRKRALVEALMTERQGHFTTLKDWATYKPFWGEILKAIENFCAEKNIPKP